jgi:hypothetical protein
MAEEKVYTPETISDAPFPSEQKSGDLGVTQSVSGGGQVYGAQKIADQGFPAKRTAVELISSALNTKSKKILAEFEFTESGALQIGKYENGVSGDVRITPNGITARDFTGVTTFALDGTTGSAVFKGSIQSGAVITGEVIVGNNAVVVDGSNPNGGQILIGFPIPQIHIGYLLGKY